MKKKLIAVSVAATLGLGAVAANAATTIAANGIGHTNIIPYFSVQDGNATLLSITNTDSVNGKAVKVRFRGAEWSDDIFDFTVFLSPGDVFTGAVTAENNLAKFATADGSCTLPLSVNQNFVPIRLQNQATGTLEGYIEIITMADVLSTGLTSTSSFGGYNLFTATKHSSGIAPCKSSNATSKANSEALLTALTQDNLAVGGGTGVAATLTNQGTWMGNPTGSLTSYATIINVAKSKAFSNLGTAVNYTAPVKAYYRQANDALTATTANTADRIFHALGSSSATPTVSTAAGAGVPMYQFDAPDLSTAIDTGVNLAVDQRNNLSLQLQKASVISEYSTLSSIQGATDVVINAPTRRYFYVYGLMPSTATTHHATIENNKFQIFGDTGTPYATLLGATNRVNLANLPSGTSAAVFFDREEQLASSNIVISPTPPGGSMSLKGEVSVIGVNVSDPNPTGALGGKLTMNGINATGPGGTVFAEGWANLSTTSTATVAAPYTTAALPVIGFTAMNVFNGGVGSAGTNYGTTLPLRYK